MMTDGAVLAAYQDPNYRARLRAWLQARIDEVGNLPAARADLQLRWPPDLPPLKSFGDHTPEQLVVIERLLNDVEAAHQMPFPVSARPLPPDAPPDDEAVARVLRLFSGAEVVPKQESEQ
jgi:hypothetical protein